MPSASEKQPSRRERVRADALAEIRRIATAQIAEGGPAALSLNAIAKEMGMSGPAIYRYHASRAALLGELASSAWDDLADALEAARAAASRRSPVNRVRAVAGAYRAWAIADPRRYGLIYDADIEQGGEVGATAHRAMGTLLGVLGEAATGPGSPIERTLERELVAWGGPGEAPWLLRLGVSAWQRIHGHVALELAGIHAAMGLDSGRLFDSEVDAVISELS